MWLTPSDLQALWLTLQVASLTTVILLLLGTPLAWWLVRSRSWVTRPVAAIIALPLVLPPTVLGFYLLVALGPHGPIGPFTQALGLRATRLDTFFHVVLPLCKPGLMTGTIMSFAHTVGEFGVVLMVGGNIPGVTRVVSVQIYDHVEAAQYGDAHRLAAVRLVFAFTVLLGLHMYQQRRRVDQSERLPGNAP